MQEGKNRQSQISFELTNNINSVNRMISTINYARPEEVWIQILNLLGYKILSEIAENTNEDIGYDLNQEYYYKNLLINKGYVVETLKGGIYQITKENDNVQASDVFYDLFDIFNFEKFHDNNTWILLIDAVNILCSGTQATSGEIFNFLTRYIGQYDRISNGVKPSEDIVKLIISDCTNVKNIYDPFATDGTLLVSVGTKLNVENYYGQHPVKESYIISKMNLLANNINYKHIFIKCHDIIEPINWDVKFDLAVTIPPFGRQIIFNNVDKRFKYYTPQKVRELVYVLDMLYNLNDDGVMKIVVPDGTLRVNQNRNIIFYLVEEMFISTVIGLPGGLLEEAGIPTTLLIINKETKSKDIYFLNLRNATTKKLSRKRIGIEDISKYVKILSNKEEIDLTSKYATIEEIQENEYNLAINRYVESEKLDEIDMAKTIANIKAIKRELKQVDEELNAKIGGLLK